MTTGTLIPALIYQGYTANGSLNALGTLATYAAGSTTPIATFADPGLTQQNMNPVQLNAIGQASIWLTPGVGYKFVEFDQYGNQCGFQDQVNASGVGISNNLIPALNNTFNIGSPSFTWANGYFGTNVYVGGSAIVTLQTPTESIAGVVPVNLQYSPGDARRYGCVLDGLTDDSVPMQLAINFCLYANIDLLIQGIAYITTPLNLNRPVANDGPYFNIRSTSGGGFKLASNFSLFTTSTTNTGLFPVCASFNSSGPVSGLIAFISIKFLNTAPGLGYVFNDNRFLRMRFDLCSFFGPNLLSGSTVGYIQDYVFVACNVRHGSGVFLQSGSSPGYFAIGCHFDWTVEAWTGDFMYLGLPIACSVKGVWEGVSGTLIRANGAQGFDVNIYTEANSLDIDFSNNGSQNYAPAGVCIHGGRFQNANPATYTINWGTLPLIGCSSMGNNCIGSLHNLPLNSHLVGTDSASVSLWNNPPVTDRASTPWTPTDGSGAGNVFTAATGSYRMPGNNGIVEFEFEITYPISVIGGGSGASITGLPFNAASPPGISDVINAATSFTTYTSYIQGLGPPGTATLGFYVLSSQLTNTQLAGKTIRMFGRYPAAV